MPPAAILDIDGTLVDTNYHHTLAWYRAFRRHDVTPEIWRIHRHIGMGGDQLVGAVAGDDVEERLGDDIREAAELTSDPELSAITDLAEVPVSLDHLRGLDPQTRIIIRAELRYEQDEGSRAGRARAQQPAVATIMPDGTVIAGNAIPRPPGQP